MSAGSLKNEGGLSSEMGPTKAYLQFLEAGRFMLQRSRSTGRYVFYPRLMAPNTGETDLEWVEASGRGVVYSTTVVRNKPPTPNANIALVDLAEGPRMMSRIDGVAPEQVRIGMQVQAAVIREGERFLVVFRPVE
jgi:uncharacterized protein